MKTLIKFIKTLFKIIFWIILIAILLAVILYLSAGKIIQHFAPDFISKVTQTETALGPVDLSLLSGRIALNNLAIGNPAGFKDKNALQVGSVSVTFDPKSVLSDKIVINTVAIDGVKVSTELNTQGKTNVSELLNNINKFTGSDTETPQKNKETTSPKTTNDKSSKAVVIRDLAINNSSVRAGIAGQMMDVPLPDIHQTNIGEQKKKSFAEIAVDILNTLNVESTKAVVKATKDALKKNIQTGKDAVKGLADTIMDLF